MPTKKVVVWEASSSELGSHYAIRHRVFVNEQNALLMTDIDEWDRHAEVIHVLAASGSSYAGVVRLYPLDEHGRWKGDRLAVLEQYRNSLVGAQLVRFATATAAAQGGHVMEATVQLGNVKFFESLGWVREGGRLKYLGLPHQLMTFDLAKARLPNIHERPQTLAMDAVVENDMHMDMLLSA